MTALRAIKHNFSLMKASGLCKTSISCLISLLKAVLTGELMSLVCASERFFPEPSLHVLQNRNHKAFLLETHAFSELLHTVLVIRILRIFYPISSNWMLQLDTVWRAESETNLVQENCCLS